MVLRIKDVCKQYGGRTILDRVSLTQKKGERLALMGPSGSGKSTLLNCMSMVDSPDSGTIELAGNIINNLDEEQQAELKRESIGTVFQFFHLLPYLNAYENIELPLQLIGIPHQERKKRIDALLEEVGITHRKDAYPDQMSGGEMQRTAIARALSIRPKIIFADEPTGNLDSKTSERILDLLESLSTKHNIAILMVTHSNASTRICHRVLNLLDGHLCENTN